MSYITIVFTEVKVVDNGKNVYYIKTGREFVLYLCRNPLKPGTKLIPMEK